MKRLKASVLALCIILPICGCNTVTNVSETAVSTSFAEPSGSTGATIVLPVVTPLPTESSVICETTADESQVLRRQTIESLLADEYEEVLRIDNTDEEFIRACYSAYEQTDPSEYEIRFLTDLLSDGYTRDDLRMLFKNDDGFLEECLSFDLSFDPSRAFTDYSADPYGFMADLPSGDHLTPIGDFIPDPVSLQMLYEAMDDLTYNYSFMLLDINTGRGLMYNIDEIYYTASSIKGPFAASFACQAPDAAAGWEGTIRSMLENSDNEAYRVLNDTYHRVYIQQWAEQIGLDPVPFGWKYPHIAVRQMAALWYRSFEFFEQDEFGAEVGTWFENPSYSLIHSELADQFVTRSKAGWLVDEDPDHTTTIDAGIVYADNGPYIVVIMSRVPSNIEPLRPLMQALAQVHSQM